MNIDERDLFRVPDDATRPEREPRRCYRHDWQYQLHTAETRAVCLRCGAIRDEAKARTGRNNRKRGNAEELTVARKLGARKVGQLGQPWDVEMTGYARLQVKKLATPPSLRFIAGELARIGSGAEMPGFVWVEPGRGGEALIVFRLADYAERHGGKE